jgi:hypothetical protein
VTPYAGEIRDGCGALRSATGWPSRRHHCLPPSRRLRSRQGQLYKEVPPPVHAQLYLLWSVRKAAATVGRHRFAGDIGSSFVSARPAVGTDAAVQFTGHRHVTLAALQSRYQFRGEFQRYPRWQGWQVVARRTRRLGRLAGPVIGVLLPRLPVRRNGAFDPVRPLSVLGSPVSASDDTPLKLYRELRNFFGKLNEFSR